MYFSNAFNSIRSVGITVMAHGMSSAVLLRAWERGVTRAAVAGSTSERIHTAHERYMRRDL